jgi:hypothetical protein
LCVGRNRIPNECVSKVELRSRPHAHSNPVRGAAAKLDFLSARQLCSSLANNRLGQANVKLVTIEVRDLALPDPDRRARRERSFAEGRTRDVRAPLHEGETHIRHVRRMLCGHLPATPDGERTCG